MTVHVVQSLSRKKLRIAPVALVVTHCVVLAVQHARHSTYDFSYTKTHELDSAS